MQEHGLSLTNIYEWMELDMIKIHENIQEKLNLINNEVENN